VLSRSNLSVTADLDGLFYCPPCIARRLHLLWTVGPCSLICPSRMARRGTCPLAIRLLAHAWMEPWPPSPLVPHSSICAHGSPSPPSHRTVPVHSDMLACLCSLRPSPCCGSVPENGVAASCTPHPWLPIPMPFPKPCFRPASPATAFSAARPDSASAARLLCCLRLPLLALGGARCRPGLCRCGSLPVWRLQPQLYIQLYLAVAGSPELVELVSAD